MENHLEGAVSVAVGVQSSEAGSEAKKNWVAPELRKFEIAEVTAANPIVATPDAGLGSS
jgi:hypothetical protein